MYREPKAAKRLYFDVIPRHVDEYQQFLEAYERQGAEGAALQSGVAHPRRRAAQGRQPGAVHDAALARHRIECGERRDAVGVHRPLPAGRDAADASASRRARRLRHPLFPRFRAAGKKIPRAERGRARGTDRPARCAVAAAGRCVGAGDPGRGLRGRPARAVPRREEEGQGRQARRRRSTGSTCSTRCCSARRRARASAPSSPPTGFRTPST